jgi:hypothetical protein
MAWGLWLVACVRVHSVNCSLYAPTPSMCAMVINKYVRSTLARPPLRFTQLGAHVCGCLAICSCVFRFSMRSDIRSYNLGGMGCSAGLISIDLAKNLLASRPGSLALVISTENITPNLYMGNQRSMQLQNTLFR